MRGVRVCVGCRDARRCTMRGTLSLLLPRPRRISSLSRARPPCIYARFDSGKRQRATRTRRKIISDLPRLRRVAVVYAAPPDPSRILENGNSSSYGVIACRARFPFFLFFFFFERNNKPSLSSFSKNERFVQVRWI